MSTQNDFPDEIPVRQGMSSTAKVLLVLGSLAGVALLACCGGVAFLAVRFQGVAKTIAQNLPTNNPQEIRARTARIVHIDIPPEFPPLAAIDLFVMKQMIYGKQGGGSMVMIMEINEAMTGGQDAGSAREQRQEIMRQMRQQQGQQAASADTELDEESSETREFEINGEKVQFEFIRGKSPNGGGPVRQVVGLFPGRQGTVMLMVMVPESEYDEAAIAKMIESIRLPGDKTEVDAAGDSEMPEGATVLERDDPAATSDEGTPEGSAIAVPAEVTP
jgi:hypothetical protein